MRYLVLVLVLGLLMAGCGGAARSGDAAVATEELRVSTDGWETDFSRHSIPLGELVSGGPPRDGIPPIDEPRFVGVGQADRFLDDREPVLVVELGGVARAYPVQILVWHEIVNDDFAGRPLAVTYCPLCNSSLVFDRRVDGRTLRFGTTGNLRKSDLVMWDDATESWWQQFGGEAIVGELTGARLTPVPAQTLGWADFRARFPDGQVLSRDTGFDRDYGSNPYTGYESAEGRDEQPFLLEEEADDRLPAKERVVAVEHDGEAIVLPFSRLEDEPVVNEEAGGRPVVVTFKPGVASALDASAISRSADVGTAAVFDRRLDGHTLTFEPDSDGTIRDGQTGSRWDITGRAIDGELRGRRLEPVVHDQQFWFAVAAFLPEAQILR